MVRSATAVWNGDLKTGVGTLTAPSGAFTGVPYSLATRFEDKPGTNPEELIAAAHAGCFAMALSGDLTKAGISPRRLEVTGEVTLDRVDGKPTVTRSHLRLRARLDGADRAAFQAAAEATRTNCPIARLLNAELTLETILED